MSKTAAKSAAKAAARRKGANGSGADEPGLGVLPDAELHRVVKSGAISADGGMLTDQIQPASLDLRLGK
ncbi:MAG TPA: 2'-deoxycytidine 5'-triphosphate deaminase, partial [Hyphomonadaceae bacterium]